MPRHAPSSQKGKQKVINRTLRSSTSHESEDEGCDAPLEPIYDFFSEPSLTQAKEKNPGMVAEQREFEADQET
jgi:hypothetical protein